jgi:hypothetical protein
MDARTRNWRRNVRDFIQFRDENGISSTSFWTVFDFRDSIFKSFAALSSPVIHEWNETRASTAQNPSCSNARMTETKYFFHAYKDFPGRRILASRFIGEME